MKRQISIALLVLALTSWGCRPETIYVDETGPVTYEYFGLTTSGVEVFRSVEAVVTVNWHNDHRVSLEVQNLGTGPFIVSEEDLQLRDANGLPLAGAPVLAHDSADPFMVEPGARGEAEILFLIEDVHGIAVRKLGEDRRPFDAFILRRSRN